ncbi:E3 ubiquitin-protein ligase mind-bomb isoform X3 [Hydra vulgaris]|uniref:E3 ubiquitin-protein ligase mind-bomb isoform X3 n=1 Tax=Hydra vulgaris TaxID=6087 RepID=A0ABM4CFR3_HYDVU
MASQTSKVDDTKNGDSGFVSLTCDSIEIDDTENRDPAPESVKDEELFIKWRNFLKEAFTPDEDGDTYLIIQIRQKNIQEAKNLINLNFHFGSKQNLDIKNKRKSSALHLALNQRDILLALICAGADLSVKDNKGHNIFHLIAITQNTEALRIILSFGQRTNQIEKIKELVNSPNYEGIPAYFLAIRYHYRKMIVLMSDNGFIDNNAKDEKNGNTALHEVIALCKINERMHVVNSLVKKCNIDVNSLNNCDVTPLHLAASANDKEACAVLLALGANCVLKDFQQQFPYSYATDDEIIEKLRVNPC